MGLDNLLQRLRTSILAVLLFAVFCSPVVAVALESDDGLIAESPQVASASSVEDYGIEVTLDGQAVSGSDIHVGQSVQISPTGLDSLMDYQFNYVWAYEGKWETWSSTVLETGDYTPATADDFIPARAGLYVLYIDIVTPDGIVSVSDSIIVCEDWTLAGIGIDATSIRIGDAATVQPEVSGPDAGFARFNYVWSYENGWDDWSSTVKETGGYTAERSWTFTPAKAGDYVLYVDAVRTDGSFESYVLHLSVIEDWDFESISVDRDDIALGESLVVQPEVSGPDAGFARFNYVWSYENGWDDWSSTVKETGGYTAERSWTFTPPKAGDYVLYVDAVRTDGSSETISCEVSVSAEWDAESLSVVDATGTPIEQFLFGQELHLSIDFAKDSNLTGMQYNFGWQFGESWNEWYSLAKEGKTSFDNGFSFTPQKAGTYTLFADAIGTDGKKQTVSVKIEVVFPFTVSGLDVDDDSILIGEDVTLTPEYTGDIESARFNYVWSYDGKWTDGDWSSTINETGEYTQASSFSFTPSKYGDYDLYLDIVYPDGSKETYSIPLTVSSGWSTAGVSIDKDSPQYVDTELTISANVAGERSSSVLYNYVVQRNGNEWSSTLMDTGEYTTEPTWHFVPEKSGNYVFYIDVVDGATGQQITISRAFTVNKTWHLERLDLAYSSPMRPFSTVTMTPVISGDTTGLLFNYVWQGDNWYVWDSNLKHGDYTSQASSTVTISDGGTYGFYVDVIDQNGEIERAEVTGVRARYTYDIINRIEGAIARQSSLNGTYVENKLLEAGGVLCNNRRGYWCANLIWYGFYENGFLDLWGTSHMQVDPEYLANEFGSMGRYYSGTGGIQRGDIVFFYWVPWRGSQYITHAAYVTGVTGSTITVAEGNMGYSSIYHTYSRWSSNIRGYARPAY